MMELKANVKLTPEQVADAIWSMYSDEQAKMFAELLKHAGSEHQLMMQFLAVRDECKLLDLTGDSTALDAFQSMFSSAYKYAWQV